MRVGKNYKLSNWTYTNNTFLESRHGQSEDIFDIAQVWLKDCIDNHKFCQHKEGHEGPTRLLFIADGEVRLVETAGRYKGQYSTLSHAWGTKPFLKLTHATYQQFLQQIPFGQLQKTFQDAISISRRLNIDFIWIDSLCIIQEDEADWTRESGRMSVVYGRSTLNIAATSAVDGSQGCFLKAPSVIGGVQTRVTVDGKPELRNFHRGQFEYDMATTSHLATRAWTVQEKVLAPRTMYIGDRGVVWECRTTIASEFLPDGFQDPLIMSIVSRGEDRLREHWSTIMELYSRASLTYASDKLPALSGMARQVADKSHDDYIAGMWMEGLDFQLCWRTVGRTTRTAYRAPSWCWTSLDGPIKLPGGYFKEELVQVLDTNVELCGEDPFGHVQGGWIKLACSTMGIGYAIGRPEPLRYWNPNSYEIKLMVGMDEWEEAPFIVERDYTDEQPGVGDKVYLVPLRAGSVGYGVGEWFSIAFCGILLQEYGSKKGEFRRVGSFQFHGEQKYESKEDAVGSSAMPITRGDYTRFKEILNQSGAETAERASTGITKHMGDIGTGYVITIV